MKNQTNEEQMASPGEDDTIMNPQESKAFSFRDKYKDKDDQNATGKLSQSNLSNSNIINLHDAEIKTNQCHLVLYIILIILQTVLTYIFKPVCTILQIVLLTQIPPILKNELVEDSDYVITTALKIIGFCLIFLLPLVNFFIIGIMIIAIQYTVIGKLYTMLIILIELIFQIPLTFMLENNLHSVFLFDQRGIEQLLCPWLVFFPSDYLLSIFELVRQYADALYFLTIGFKEYMHIKDNRYQAFSVSIVLVIIVLCIFRMIGNTVMLAFRIVYGTSEERGLKKDKKKKAK